MTSINSLGGGASNLIWALYKNASTNATSATNATDATSDTSKTDTTTQTDSTTQPAGLNSQGSQLNANIFMVLIDAQSQSSGSGTQPQDGSSLSGQLLNSLDTDGDGTVSQSELEKAFGADGGTTDQADTLFKSLDANNDGSVSQDELQSGLKAAHHGGGHHHHHGGGGGAGAAGAAGTDPMSALLTDIEGTETTTNADGSSTTMSFSEMLLSENAPGSDNNGTSSNNPWATNGSSTSASSANPALQASTQSLMALMAKFQAGMQQTSSVGVNA